MENLFLENYLFRKNRYLIIFFMYLCFFVTPKLPSYSKVYEDINKLVKSCYEDVNSCEDVLFKINQYQKNAVKYKKFSCQTRLLGLEANIIMAMNSNFKKKEAKSLIDDVKRYC